MNRCRILLALMLPLLHGIAGAAVIPDLKTATLEVDGKMLRPACVVPVGRGGRLVDELVVAIQNDRIVAMQATDGVKKWTARSKGGQDLQLLAAERHVLFLQQWETRSIKGRERYHIATPGEIQRVSTTDGRWLRPLVSGCRSRLVCLLGRKWER